MEIRSRFVLHLNHHVSPGTPNITPSVNEIGSFAGKFSFAMVMLCHFCPTQSTSSTSTLQRRALTNFFSAFHNPFHVASCCPPTRMSFTEYPTTPFFSQCHQIAIILSPSRSICASCELIIRTISRELCCCKRCTPCMRRIAPESSSRAFAASMKRLLLFVIICSCSF